MGTGSGAIVFDENGNLQSVAVGSDTTAAPKAVADVVATAIPYYAALKAFSAILNPVNEISEIPNELINAINFRKRKIENLDIDPLLQYKLKEYIFDSRLNAEQLKVKYCVPGKVEQKIARRITRAPSIAEENSINHTK